MKLPIVSGKEVIKALGKIDFEFDHQKGSHITLRKSIHPFTRVTVPNHKVIVPRTLLSIMKQAGLEREEFIRLLK